MNQTKSRSDIIRSFQIFIQAKLHNLRITEDDAVDVLEALWTSGAQGYAQLGCTDSVTRRAVAIKSQPSVCLLARMLS